MAGWEDSIKDEPKSSWEDSIKDETTEVESGIRGLAQGASMGFADEVTGGLEALWNTAKGDPKTFGELYKESRDESRAKYQEAQEANPMSYTAGQVGGAVGTSFIPGLGGATLGKLVGMGAAQGLGESEAELAEGDVGGLVKDAAIGGAIGGASFGAGKALEKGTKLAGQGLSKLGDLTAEGIEDGSKVLINKLGGVDEDIATMLTRDFGDDAMSGVRKAASSGDAGKIEGSVLKYLDDKGLAYKVTPDKLTQGSKEIAEAFSKKPTTNLMQDVGAFGGLEYLVPGLGKAYGLGKAGYMGYKAASNPSSVMRGYTAAEGISRVTSDVLAKIAPTMGKYSKILQNAAQRGGQSVTATDFILMQTDPDYQKAKKRALEQEDGTSNESEE